jgi:hypothetical protein
LVVCGVAVGAVRVPRPPGSSWGLRGELICWDAMQGAVVFCFSWHARPQARGGPRPGSVHCRTCRSQLCGGGGDGSSVWRAWICRWLRMAEEGKKDCGLRMPRRRATGRGCLCATGAPRLLLIAAAYVRVTIQSANRSESSRGQSACDLVRANRPGGTNTIPQTLAIPWRYANPVWGSPSCV